MADIDSVGWYTSQFPESQFLVSPEHQKEYNKRTIWGHHIAQNSSVLICGIMRDVGDMLPYTMARINRLGSYFNKHHVFIYENDSIDDTKEQLGKYSGPDISVLMEDVNAPPFLDPRGGARRFWMAQARNKYLHFARQYALKHRIDFLIIVDTDLEGGWSYHGVLNSLGHNEWDVIGSNSLYYRQGDEGTIRLFYDSWAFRSEGRPQAIEDTTVNLFQFHRGEPLVRVNSCFGGLGIYKPHFLFDSVDYDESDCDHPTLHNQLCEKDYRIFLNPSQITLYNRTDYI